MALLDSKGIPYRYREYTESPLSVDELEALFHKLKCAPGDVLRKRDSANRDLGLTGDEDAAVLIRHMVERSTLLQRPIGVLGERAILGRPPERLLDLFGS